MTARIEWTASSTDYEADFGKLFTFLSQYGWIHDLHLTRFFASRAWENVPEEWSKAFSAMTMEELNRLPFCKDENLPGLSSYSSTNSYQPLEFLSTSPPISSTHPFSLSEFLRTSSSLSLCREQAVDRLPSPTPVGKELSKGMSPKKLHEVEWMASLVHQVASQSGCSVIVDVGSGLGYLGQVLHTQYGLSVIGLESSTGHSEGAEKRAAKKGLQCSGIRSVPFFISGDKDNIQHFSHIIRSMVSAIKPCHHSSRLSFAKDFNQSTADLNQKDDSKSSSKTDSNFLCDTNSKQSAVGLLQESSGKDLNLNATSTIGNGASAHDEEQTTKHLAAMLNTISPSTVTRDIYHISNKGSAKIQNTPAGGTDGKSLRVCLIGLHCCGDLTPAMLRLYHKVDFLTAFCCVSCCYHKMKVIQGQGTGVQGQDASGQVQSAAGQVQGAGVHGQGGRVQGHDPEATAVVTGQKHEVEVVEDQKGEVKVVQGQGCERTVVQGQNSDGKVVQGQHFEGKVVEGKISETKCIHGQTSEGKVVEGQMCYIKDQLPVQGEGQVSVEFVNFPMSNAAKKSYSKVCSQEHTQKQTLPSSFQVKAGIVSSSLSSVTSSVTSNGMTSSVTSSEVETSPSYVKMERPFLSPCSLRLAAQETRARWASQTAEDHDSHERHVGFRALLQLLLDEEDVCNDRKYLRRLNYASFDSFVQSYVDPESEERWQELQDKLYSMYRRLQPYFKQIEPFTCLQVVLQPVLETLISRDRQQWLREQGLASQIVPVFHEHISPRNLALVSFKQ